MSETWHRPETPFRAPEPIRDLIAAINDKARAAQTGLFSMLAVGIYILATALSTSDLDLLMDKSTPIAQLGVQVPVVVSFAILPVVFLGLHAFTLIRYHLLTLDLASFCTELPGQVPNHKDRDRCQRLLANTEFVQIMSAPKGSRRRGWLVHSVAWVLVAVIPVLVLLIVEISALRLQSPAVTETQQASIVVDIGLILWFIVRIRNAQGSFKVTRYPWRDLKISNAWQLAQMCVSLALMVYVLLFLFLYATIPGSGANTVVVGRNLRDHIAVNQVAAKQGTTTNAAKQSGWPSQFFYGTVHSAHKEISTFLEQPLDLILCPDTGWGCRYLSIQRRTLVDSIWGNGDPVGLIRQGDVNPFQALASVEGIDLSHRNMLFADFYESRIFSANFRFSNIERANFKSTNLTGSSFDGANLSQSDLAKSRGLGVSFRHANLTAANLGYSSFEGADFSDAALYGAKISPSDLLGANLTGVCAVGADLAESNLEAATIRDGNFVGAKFNYSDLLAADIAYSDIRGADLRGAFFGGAFALQQTSGGIAIGWTRKTANLGRIQPCLLAGLEGARHLERSPDISLSILDNSTFTRSLNMGTRNSIVRAVHYFPDASVRRLATNHINIISRALKRPITSATKFGWPPIKAAPHSIFVVKRPRGLPIPSWPVSASSLSDGWMYQENLGHFLVDVIALENPGTAVGVAERALGYPDENEGITTVPNVQHPLKPQLAIGCRLVAAIGQGKVSFAGYETVLARLTKTFSVSQCAKGQSTNRQEALDR